MAGKTLINGTAYDISGGKTMVNGTNYSIAGGKTMVGGTNYDIGFSDYVFVDHLILNGSSNLYFTGITTPIKVEVTLSNITASKVSSGNAVIIWIGNSSNYHNLRYTKTDIRLFYATGSVSVVTAMGGVATLLDRHTYTLFSNYGTQTLYRDGTEILARTAGNSVTGTQNVQLFAGGNTFTRDGNFYGADIYQSTSTLIMRLKPAVRKSDGVAGALNILNGTFYTSNSSTPFGYA